MATLTKRDGIHEFQILVLPHFYGYRASNLFPSDKYSFKTDQALGKLLDSQSVLGSALYSANELPACV